MKRNSIHQLIILLFLSMLVYSCKQKKSDNTNDITFADIKIKKHIHLFNDSTKPGADFSLEMQYPNSSTNSKALNKLQELFVISYFGDKYAGMPPEKSVEVYTNEYVKNYKALQSEYERYKNEFPEESNDQTFNYIEHSSIKIEFNSFDFVCFSVRFETYTGGAHGMHSKVYHVIDTKTMKLLTLSDIFQESNFDKVSELIVDVITKKQGLTKSAQLEEIGYFSVNDIKPNDNFMLNESGITWEYNPYEIAAYAVGSTNVTIPWEELKPYILQDSAVLRLTEK